MALRNSNAAAFRMHPLLLEFEQESDSQFWKNSGTGSGFKNFATRAESNNVTPAASGLNPVLAKQCDKATPSILRKPLRSERFKTQERRCLDVSTSVYLWKDERTREQRWLPPTCRTLPSNLLQKLARICLFQAVPLTLPSKQSCFHAGIRLLHVAATTNVFWKKGGQCVSSFSQHSHARIANCSPSFWHSAWWRHRADGSDGTSSRCWSRSPACHRSRPRPGSRPASGPRSFPGPPPAVCANGNPRLNSGRESGPELEVALRHRPRGYEDIWDTTVGEDCRRNAKITEAQIFEGDRFAAKLFTLWSWSKPGQNLFQVNARVEM